MSGDFTGVLVIIGVMAGLATGLIGMVWMAMHIQDHGLFRDW